MDSDPSRTGGKSTKYTDGNSPQIRPLDWSCLILKDFNYVRDLGHKDDVDGLVEALGDPELLESKICRRHIIYELGRLQDSRAVGPLVELLEKDHDEDTNRQVVTMLGKIGDPSAAPAVRSAMNRSERTMTRFWAAWSLGELRDRESVEDLIRYARDPTADVLVPAAQALGRIGDHRATPALIDLLDDPDRLVRRTAAYALVNLGDSRALGPMRDAYGRLSWWKRRVVRGSLQELDDLYG